MSVDYFQQQTMERTGSEDVSYRYLNLGAMTTESFNFTASILKWCRRVLMIHAGDPPKHGSNPDPAIAEMQRDLATVFFRSNPRMYYHTVEFALLIHCMYVALWATNFCVIAKDSHYAVLWEFALALPIVVNFIILRNILFCACMLKSLSSLDTNISDKLCEEALNERLVTQRLRKTIRTALSDILPDEKFTWHVFLHMQFKEYAADQTGVDPEQFCNFLHSIQVRLTMASVDNIFRVIDYDGDGFVRWDDLFVLIFPELLRDRHKKKKSRRNASSVITNDIPAPVSPVRVVEDVKKPSLESSSSSSESDSDSNSTVSDFSNLSGQRRSSEDGADVGESSRRRVVSFSAQQLEATKHNIEMRLSESDEGPRDSNEDTENKSVLSHLLTGGKGDDENFDI